MKKFITFILCLTSLAASAAGITDSLKKNPPVTDTAKHAYRSVILPAGLAVYGGLSFAITPLRNFDYYINNQITQNAPGFKTSVEDYLQFAPAAIVYGLNLAGYQGKNDFVNRTAILGISYGILGVSVETAKHLTHRMRPDGSDNLSFFSGHTSSAFLCAEFLNQEYGAKSPWLSVAGYTIAGATGVLRLYNHDHWFSDVITGAGMGMLSAKAGYYIYPYVLKRLSHTSKNGKKAFVMPAFYDGTKGLSLAMQL